MQKKSTCSSFRSHGGVPNVFLSLFHRNSNGFQAEGVLQPFRKTVAVEKNNLLFLPKGHVW